MVDTARAAQMLGTLLSAWKEEGTTSSNSNDVISNLTSTTPTTSTSTQDYSPPSELGHPTGSAFPVAGAFGENREGHIHAGVDLSTPVGTGALAAINGVVTHAANDDPNGYGNWVEITGPDGISVRYGHLSQIQVSVGNEVKVGMPIGKTGGVKGADGSGNSEGPHLHFEVRKAGTAIDPGPWINAAAGDGGTAPAAATADTPAPASNTVTPENAGQITTDALSAPTDLSIASGDVHRQGQPATTPNASGTSGTDGTMDSYFAEVLKRVGAPATSANLTFMRAWQQAEGGDTTNPFNTTQDAPGASDFNSVGVKRYANQQSGIDATVKTLLNGRYGGIIKAMQDGSDPLAVARALAASPWGTGGLVIKVLGG